MIEINGKSAFNALAMGPLHFLNFEQKVIKRLKTDDPNGELVRLKNAQEKAKEELSNLYQKALVSVGETNAQVFEIHIMMLEDEDYFGAISNMIKNQSVNAEYAVSYTSDIFARTFSEMTDEYMRARREDVLDISKRLVNILNGNSGDTDLPDIPSIIVAPDLSPSETVKLDPEKVLGFVTFKGSSTSHTAILARTMNIPALINTGEISKDLHGKLAILDGHSATLYVGPDDAKVKDFMHRKQLDEKHSELLNSLRGKPNETKSGKKINIYANIGSPKDVSAAIASDAGGIGLFRSEFLYLEKSDYPSEDEQFLKYKEVAERIGPKPVIIRTLDIGADKKVDYFNLPEEENPALGFRAIRICLTDTKVFKTQLRAILRASAFGNVLIMFPMIISQSEVEKALAILEECKAELQADKIPFNKNIPVGIMVETPAAAIISDVLSPLVDFFSIGTNDLTQYTLALDRQNHSLEPFLNTHHQAILRLIEKVSQNAHKHGKWVGICGELASDQSLVKTFLDMDIDELSVSPSEILRLREVVRSLD